MCALLLPPGFNPISVKIINTIKICTENQILLKASKNRGHFSMRPILLLLATFSHDKSFLRMKCNKAVRITEEI
jgi:hypothetical protein